ncbi:MAG TPA: flagellar basal body-associated protein FliL [Rhodocyclaceae bacterium]|nr:flagellar basal body-associated protein FliL [Rhodocyclaceae bacterium]
MAKDAKAAAEGEQAVAPAKSKKLLIIILAAVLVLVLGGGGAAFFLLKKGGDEAGDDEDAAETSQPKKKKGKEGHPVFVNLDPFTVNLVPETGDQYLQVSLSVEFEEPTAEQLVKLHMPKIRNNVTLLLSGKKASEILSKEGKQTLAEELKDTINDVLEPSSGKKKKSAEGPAKEVLFTSFIIQ